MDVDDADVEGALLESGPFQDLHDRPDRVVAAQVVIQPQLVHVPVPVLMKEFDSGSARTGHLRAAAIDKRTKVIDQNDRSAGIHAMMMPGAVTIRHPDLPQSER